MERIFVPKGMEKYLENTFNRSHVFVWKALKGETTHPDALRVRELAKKKLAELQGGQ